MYERSYGYLYSELGQSPTNTDIAKAIRADIKQAVAEGLLPARWTYSVRSDNLAVSVMVQDCADAFQACDGRDDCHDVWCVARNDPRYAHAAHTHDVLTEEAKVARMTLQRIHSAYNHDGSELQADYFDVRYYGGVSFEDSDSAAFRARETERLAAKKNARENGTTIGRVRNYKRDGSSVTHLLIEANDGKQVLGCGARIYRGSLISRVSDSEPLTCSRCAKRHAANKEHTE